MIPSLQGFITLHFRQESAILTILEHLRQMYEVLPERVSFSKPAKFLLESMVPIIYSALRSLLLTYIAGHVTVFDVSFDARLTILCP